MKVPTDANGVELHHFDVLKLKRDFEHHKAGEHVVIIGHHLSDTTMTVSRYITYKNKGSTYSIQGTLTVEPQDVELVQRNKIK